MSDNTNDRRPLFHDVPPKYKHFLASALRFKISALMTLREELGEEVRWSIDNDLPLYVDMLRDAQK